LFLSSRIHGISPRRFGALVISGALVAGFAGIAFANQATAAHVDGVEYTGNPDCASLAPDGVEWEEFKIDKAPSSAESPYTAGEGLQITISNASSQSFDWASNFDMSAVLVKGSDGGLRYQYPGADDKSDTGLHAVVHDEAKDEQYHAISHVSFCYKVGGDTVVTSTTATTATSVTTANTPTTASTPTTAAVVPSTVAPAVQGSNETEVLGETLVQDTTLPRTGTAATHTLVLLGGMVLAFGVMILTLTRRKVAIQSS
jgi:LPXTG-motif cell wall-anchored protein